MNDLNEEEIKTLLASMSIRILVIEETAKTINCEATKQNLYDKREKTKVLYDKLSKLLMDY